MLTRSATGAASLVPIDKKLNSPGKKLVTYLSNLKPQHEHLSASSSAIAVVPARPGTPPASGTSLALLSFYIQQVDFLELQCGQLSVATNWTYYKTGAAYAAYCNVSARSSALVLQFRF